MSYSQGGEQAAILAAVGAMTGSVLDVGAAHPTIFSNSRALIELGWHAVLVEASFDHFDALYDEYRNHPRVELVLAAVGTHWGITPFWHTQDLVSTTDSAHYEKWKDQANFDGKFRVVTVPLLEIIRILGPFDVISLDIEGRTHTLFQDALAHEPKVIVIEHDNDRTIEQRAFAKGYDRVYASPENWIFVK